MLCAMLKLFPISALQKNYHFFTDLSQNSRMGYPNNVHESESLTLLLGLSQVHLGGQGARILPKENSEEKGQGGCCLGPNISDSQLVGP